MNGLNRTQLIRTAYIHPLALENFATDNTLIKQVEYQVSSQREWLQIRLEQVLDVWYLEQSR